jgi:diacylglycerol kinase (ATP)
MVNRPYSKHKINLQAFAHAWDGIIYSFTTQKNFKIHLSLATLALIASFLLHVPNSQKVLLVFAVVLGLSAEMINTAVESVVNLVTGEWRKQAKIAKDVAAGMMLLTAIGTTIIAALILLPPFLLLLIP